MKGLNALGTILRNSSTNSNLKQIHLSENLKGSYINYTDKNLSLLFNETCLYIYIYIYIYVVPSISFQTFFVRAFKIVVDT